jgi:hypothetical protein
MGFIQGVVLTCDWNIVLLIAKASLKQSEVRC